MEYGSGDTGGNGVSMGIDGAILPPSNQLNTRAISKAVVSCCAMLLLLILLVPPPREDRPWVMDEDPIVLGPIEMAESEALFGDTKSKGDSEKWSCRGSACLNSLVGSKGTWTINKGCLLRSRRARGPLQTIFLGCPDAKLVASVMSHVHGVDLAIQKEGEKVSTVLVLEPDNPRVMEVRNEVDDDALLRHFVANSKPLVKSEIAHMLGLRSREHPIDLVAVDCGNSAATSGVLLALETAKRLEVSPPFNQLFLVLPSSKKKSAAACKSSSTLLRTMKNAGFEELKSKKGAKSFILRQLGPVCDIQ